MSKSRDLALWLAWLLPQPKLRRAAKSVFYQWVVDAGEPVTALANMPEGELSHRFQIKLGEAQGLISLLPDLPLYEARVDHLRQQGIAITDRADVAYPELFGERMQEARLPYLLFHHGPLELLTEPGLCVFGASEPTADGLAMAQQVGGRLAQSGHCLIGGYDRGIDRAALEAGLEAGGTVIAMLPCGLAPMAGALAHWEAAIDAGRALVVSPYGPETAYTQPLGEARQPLIAANSLGAVLIEPTHEPLAQEWWPVLYESGGLAWIWDGSDKEMLHAWVSSGPTRSFHAADEFLADLPEAQDYSEDTEDIDLSDPATATGDVELADMAPFESANEAIDALSGAGAIPDVLAKRLRKRHGEHEEER